MGALPDFDNVAAQFIGNTAGGVPIGDSFKDAINAATGDVKTSLQQAWDNQTGQAATAQRIQDGAADAGELVTNGFDPDNAGDRQKLVGAIAGGLALIPGPGPVLAGVFEGMYQVGNALAPIINKLWPQGCWHSGPLTTSKDVFAMWPQIITGHGSLPPMPHGSFAELVMNALAAAEADSWNCKSTPQPQQIVAGLAAIWNAHASGPAQDIFVPALSLLFGPGSGAVLPNALSIIPGKGAIYDAVSIPPFLSQAQLKYAFQPIASVPSWVLDWTARPASGGTSMSVLHLAGSSMTPPTPPPPPIHIAHVLTLKGPALAAAAAAKTGAPASAAKVAIKKVLTLHLSPSAAATAAVTVKNPAARQLLGAANKAVISAPQFWVAYYAGKAKADPLPYSHPFAAIIARDLVGH